MKKLRGIVTALLCIVLAAFVLSGCEKTSSQIETEHIEEIRAENVADVADYTQTYFAGTMTSATYEEFANYLAEGHTVVSRTFDNSWANRWKQFTDSHGAVTAAAVDLTQRTHKGGYTSRILLTGEDGKQMALTISYDEGMIPYATAIGEYSDDSSSTLGAKMGVAAGNTVTGLLVVFAILVGLSLIISCFKFVNKVGGEVKPENKDAKKAAAKVSPKAAPAPKAAAAPQAASAPKAEEDNLAKDMELIAVIAAAISAYEGKPVRLFAAGDPNAEDSKGYVVRSIRRLHNNKWH